ncbi:MAG: hypothetical protein K2M94_01200 [Paramuribaculum sp.]|nr:hypothetical protein [Paramuribaculum sp.]
MVLLLPVLCFSCSSDNDVRSLVSAVRDTAWDNPLPEMPEPTVSLPNRWRGDTYGRTFNDSNYLHWAQAERIGIRPIENLKDYWKPSRPMVKLVSCADYYVEPMRYSEPFMIPEGEAMVREIGRRFHDTLQSRGGGAYSIKVTSVLRTPRSVKHLRRVNRNSIDSSVHQLGTTVDISYSRFAAYNDTMPRSVIDLKAILAEVLAAMRSEGKCLIKHERKQPCFHITVCAGYGKTEQ